MENTTPSNLFELQVDHDASTQLREAARWAKFLAILGFIFCGLIALAGIFFAALMSAFMPPSAYGSANPMAGFAGMFGFIYVIFAVIGFFPNLFLYRFGSRASKATSNNDQARLNLSLRNLKAYFRFLGILAILVIGLYLLILIIAVIAGTFSR